MNSLNRSRVISEDDIVTGFERAWRRKPEADGLTIPVVDAGSDSLGAGISNSGLLKDTWQAEFIAPDARLWDCPAVVSWSAIRKLTHCRTWQTGR
jgi:hypothetical protein